jgi:enamine deaminase RidA (YjgF/YER057c/UK114 family)
MTPEQKAKELGLEFPEQQKGYLNLCCRAGNLYFLSGHVSDMKGILGTNISWRKAQPPANGGQALRVSASQWYVGWATDYQATGVRLFRAYFTDQHLVINGASDLFHEIFGKDGDGYHARSALGFAALPTGAAVEVEAIIEIKHG